MTAPLSTAGRAALLELARAGIAHRLGAGPAARLPADPALQGDRAAFVTLLVGGAVRASLGALDPQGPLAATVARLAGQADRSAQAAAASRALAAGLPARQLPFAARLIEKAFKVA